MSGVLDNNFRNNAVVLHICSVVSANNSWSLKLALLSCGIVSHLSEIKVQSPFEGGSKIAYQLLIKKSELSKILPYTKWKNLNIKLEYCNSREWIFDNVKSPILQLPIVYSQIALE